MKSVDYTMSKSHKSNENTGGIKRPGIILILGILTAFVPFSVDTYLPAMSDIASHFGTTPARMTFSLTTFFIGFATGQIIYGPLLDRFGRKVPMYYGLILSILASAGCIFAWNEMAFIGFRFIQALGASVASVAALTMVRDFFPPAESAKVFSLLVLVIGSSPLLAPTIGGFITGHYGWPWIFVFLSVMAIILLLIVWFVLPVKYTPGEDATLRIPVLLKNYWEILTNAQFITFALAGAFSFSSLFIYVAGAPIIFMESYRMTAQEFGILFAILSIGFIGGSQLNILVLKKFSSRQIFMFALLAQIITGITFLIGVMQNWYGRDTIIVLLFVLLLCLGFTSPNGIALALAPIHKNLGSASALIGTLRIGIAGLSSGGVGLLKSTNSRPVALMIIITVTFSLLIFIAGSVRMRKKGISVQL